MRNTGAVIVRLFRAQNLDPVAVPGVLVAGHAPFTWGKTPAEAVEHADVLEYIARLAFRSMLLGAPEAGIPSYVKEHHYLRKHGPNADLRPAHRAGIVASNAGSESRCVRPERALLRLRQSSTKAASELQRKSPSKAIDFSTKRHNTKLPQTAADEQTTIYHRFISFLGGHFPISQSCQVI